MVSSVKILTEIPGPNSRRLLKMVEEHVPRGVYHVTPIAVSHAKDALITDVDGNTYIDFTGGIGALNVGHCADAVVEAIKEQAEKFLHVCFHVVLYEPYAYLAKKLNEITPGNFPKKTMFANSGAEAVENAVKIARAYTKRPAIIAFERGFHGRTLLAMTLTGQVHPYKAGFGPFAPEVYRMPFPYSYQCSSGPTYPCCSIHTADYLYEMFKSHVPAENVAAIIVEPILGEGGFVVPPKDYLARLKEICQEKGILFIADEVQTGFGRTGKMFAMEHYNVEPDIIVTAKSLAGGTALSAVTGRAEIMDAPQAGGLGGTYGGNPLACAAALATIDFMEKERLVERSQEIGDRTIKRFTEMQEEYNVIGDVRGLGAMVAMELVKDRITREPDGEATGFVVKRCYEQGLLILRAGGSHNVIRTLMPLVITNDQLDEGLSILEQAIKEIPR